MNGWLFRLAASVSGIGFPAPLAGGDFFVRDGNFGWAFVVL